MGTTRSGWKHLATGKTLQQFGITDKMQVFKETLVKDTGHGDDLSSEISFIPPNHNFTVMMTASASPSAGFDIDVQGAIASGGSYATIKSDLQDNASTTTASAAVYKADPANSTPEVQLPFYKLFIDSDGAFGNGDTITLFIAVAPKAKQA